MLVAAGAALQSRRFLSTGWLFVLSVLDLSGSPLSLHPTKASNAAISTSLSNLVLGEVCGAHSVEPQQKPLLDGNAGQQTVQFDAFNRARITCRMALYPSSVETKLYRLLRAKLGNSV